MVCLGNICRSPIAEGLMKDKILKNKLDWTVDSAGTESYHIGEAPHQFSQKICLANNVDISMQRARKFVKEDLQRYDKIYAMAGDVYQEIKKIGGKGADLSNVDYFLNELDKNNLKYQVIVAGKGLNDNLKKRIENTPNILYTGFIPDLNQLLKACDIMLNPVILGGGIKTKAIEALGYNKIVISAQSGAAGLVPEVCGDNLLISPDHDWDTFTADVIKAAGMHADIPKVFYDMYYWGNIARNILAILKGYKR